MVEANRWILPDGVEDIFPERARSVERMRRRLLDLYECWGYDLVIPPMLEYTESLLTAAGEDLDLMTFRVTDQSSGRMMGIRADITPQTARMDAHSLAVDGPSRLCYAGTVLHTRARDPLSSRTPISIGVELFGERCLQADLEVISLFLESLKVAEVGRVCLDLGHVDICRGLLREAHLDAERERQFFALLQHKAVRDIQQWISTHIKDTRLAQWLMLLPTLMGGTDVLDRAQDQLRGAPCEVLAALKLLREVATAVSQNEVDVYFDLSEMPGYHYHTGLVFGAYARGYGKTLGNGGRYDHIGEAFGRSRPATGFAFDLYALVSQGTIDSGGVKGICFIDSGDREIFTEAERLRAAGERVVQLFAEHQVDYYQINCDRKLLRRKGRVVIKQLCEI